MMVSGFGLQDKHQGRGTYMHYSFRSTPPSVVHDHVRTIGDHCEGFISIDSNKKCRNHLLWARLCIKCPILDLFRGMELTGGEWSHKIMILSNIHNCLKPTSQEKSGKATLRMAKEQVGVTEAPGLSSQQRQNIYTFFSW